MDGRRAGYGVQLPMANDLRNEASIKPQMDGVWRASGLMARWRFGESSTPGESMDAPYSSP